jgi:AraC family transcriptional regulator of adaptative response/methylated-DNA-[protein]-cysteine methyltransferase
VVFFASAEDAESAGFRACLRCRPREAASSEGERKVARAARYIEQHLDERLTLRRLASEVGLSPGYLQRKFAGMFGQSPRRYQATLRTEELKRQLKGGRPVSIAGYGAGFGSTRGLYEQARTGLAMSPGAYRQGGAGMTITYDVTASSLGSVLVGRTERGVCSVILGDDEGSVVASLAAEFPRAGIERDSGPACVLTEAVVARVAGLRGYAEVPLDLVGTEFQRRVWAELQRIPAGATASYAEVAASIGAPRAVRAVASACAGNHVAVIVPCHRVVRQDGGIGGYKWGVARKKRLLEREQEG